MNKQIYGRFCQKHDVEENWLQAKNFAPLEGEIIIYDADKTHAYPRIKIGIWDGTSEKTNDMLVSNLPFVQIDSEDVDELLKHIECETLSVREADGDNVFSIAEGTRITGGSTNKDMITEMVGSLGALTVTLEEAKAHQDMSLAFGANSDTYGAGTVSFGVNTSAGTMAYYWDAITFGDKPTIQLSTTRRSSTRIDPSYPSTVDWAKGDRVTIKTKDSNWVLAGTIESVSGNVITLDAALPFTDIGYRSTLSVFTYAMPHDRTIHNIDKPESGVVSIGFGAIAMGSGYQNKTRAPGMLSLALGYETLAAGSMAVAAGKNTEAGYASLAIGAEAKALGETSLAVGTKTKASAAYAIAGGQTTEATGTGSVALGVGSKATKWTALAAGSTAIAEGNAAISLGNNTQATADGAVALGYVAKATATGALAQGQRTVASGEGAHAEGIFSQATAMAAHAEGGGEDPGVATKAIAAYAHAEGYRNIAEGPHSHAEGAKTHTIGGSSHTEGEGTIAKGGRSHAGGYGSVTIGSNAFAHGENVETGYQIEISNTYTLADYNNDIEGATGYWICEATGRIDHEQFASFVALIQASSAYPFSYNGNSYKVRIVGEGCEAYWNGVYESDDVVGISLREYEVASWIETSAYVDCVFECDASISLSQSGGGQNSAAFGLKTQAQGNNQFVLGRHNVADKDSQYALIIGNGSSDSPSNAMTLDWSGKGQFKGDVVADSISLANTFGIANNAFELAELAKLRADEAWNYADSAMGKAVDAWELASSKPGAKYSGSNEIFNDLGAYNRFKPDESGWIGFNHIEGYGESEKHYIEASNHAHLQGANNKIRYSSSAHVGGEGNDAYYSVNALIAGFYNNAENAPNSLVAGSHNNAIAPYQAVFGKYNLAASDALLMVGNGSKLGDVIVRGNAMTVYENGTVKASKFVLADETPLVSDKDIKLGIETAAIRVASQQTIPPAGVDITADSSDGAIIISNSTYGEYVSIKSTNGITIGTDYQNEGRRTMINQGSAIFGGTVEVASTITAEDFKLKDGTSMGDIARALERIIAIQETLIGGN